MTALHDPLYFVAGDTWEIVGTLLGSNNLPLDLTGAAVTWILNDANGMNVMICDLTSDGGIEIISDPSQGQVLVTVLPELSAEVDAGVYKDWMRVVLSDGSKFTEWNGFIRVAPDPDPA